MGKESGVWEAVGECHFINYDIPSNRFESNFLLLHNSFLQVPKTIQFRLFIALFSTKWSNLGEIKVVTGKKEEIPNFLCHSTPNQRHYHYRNGQTFTSSQTLNFSQDDNYYREVKWVEPSFPLLPSSTSKVMSLSEVGRSPFLLELGVIIGNFWKIEFLAS